jgi:hypothetical protein
MSMTTDLATSSDGALAMTADQEAAGMAALGHVLGSGDLAQLTDSQRVGHYLRLCRSLALNPLSRPFDWVFMKGAKDEPERLVLYANQSCAAQLRRQHHMRIEITRREIVGELFVCEATATTPDGRVDTSSKYVPLTGQYGPLKGRLLANAMMSAETGAKRRVTLSMVGLASPPDADEIQSWRPVVVDGAGRVLEHPTPEQRYLATNPRAARVLGEQVYEDAAVDDLDAQTQAARPEELTRPQRPDRPSPTFTPTPEDVRRWLGAWFASVTGTSLDDDEARHRFVRQWTAQYPEGIRTESLRAFFEHATERQAADLLAQVRAIVDDEKRSLAAAQAVEDDDEERPF